MSYQCEWLITGLERSLSDGYVFSANWQVLAREGNHYACSHGSVSLDRPENLIPYESLTSDLCLKWIKDSLGQEEVLRQEENARVALQRKLHPDSLIGTPWE